MTIEQAKKVLKSYIYCNEVDCDCLCNRCEANYDFYDYLPASKAIVAELERLDKYRWHDLRENPNDLPESFHNVLICAKGCEGIADGVFVAIHNNRRNVWGTTVNCFNAEDVIAWREIEPFEEV